MATTYLAEGVKLMRDMLDNSRHEISSLRSYALCLSWLAVAKFRDGDKQPVVRDLITEALQVNQAAVDLDPGTAKTRDEREVILQNARDAGLAPVLISQASQH